jgi:hypothetical protein
MKQWHWRLVFLKIKVGELPASESGYSYRSSNARHLLVEDAPELLPTIKRYRVLVENIIAEGNERSFFHVSDPKMAALAILGALNMTGRWYEPGGPLTAQQIGEHYAQILVGGLIHPFEMQAAHRAEMDSN